jgi:hypothetical protein
MHVSVLIGTTDKQSSSCGGSISNFGRSGNGSSNDDTNNNTNKSDSNNSNSDNIINNVCCDHCCADYDTVVWLVGMYRSFTGM